MRGNYRRKNRGKGGQNEVTFKQERFDGGYVSDIPGSDLPKDTMALLENFNAFPEYLEGRSGSQLYSATALPGSGTIYDLKFQPQAKKWLLHRGTQLWVASAGLGSWTEIKSIAFYAGATSPTIAGDTGAHFANLLIRGANTTNTNGGILYWNFSNSAGTRTLSVYKNSAKTQLVAQGTTTGALDIYASQRNSSGLGVTAQQGYTGDDTDAGNTFTVDPAQMEQGFQSGPSTIKPYKNDFLVFIGGTIPSGYGPLAYVNLTDNKFYSLGVDRGYGYPFDQISDVGTQSSGTPYGRRYLCTFSRISGTNRVTGALAFESPSNDLRPNAATIPTIDYGEHWVANPITVTNPNTVTLSVSSATLIGTIAKDYYTHVSLYATLDIGLNGVDPVTGSGNNRELYVWVDDVDITKSTYSDTTEDDQLRARIGSGFLLKNRFFKPLPGGECGEITNNFIYQAARSDKAVYYCHLIHPENMGFYNPAFQYQTLDDGVQIIAKSPDMVSYICSNSTYISSPNSYLDAGNAAIGSIYILQHLTKASSSIGCTDYGSFAAVDSANQLGQFGSGGSTAFIARCSDNTIRIWNNSSWSTDLSSRRVNKIVQTMVPGSVGAYWKGIYKLYYRTSTGSLYNAACLRFGMSSDAGFGWSQETGTALPLPQTYLGVGTFVDDNGVQRMYCLDASDGLFYWIETFTGYTGSLLTKYFLDKVAVNGTGGTAFTCKARFREITGPSEGLDVVHKEAHIFDRPYDESIGYLSGFARNYLAYVDGSSTATGSLTGIAKNADLQFFEMVAGKRIQPEVQFSRSGARLTGFEALLDSLDRAKIGNGPSAYTDATNQAALAQNMKVWLSRPQNLLNRASGSSFTLTGTAPTNVTGPDGKTYALSFVSGASYSLAETTSYTDFTLHFWVKSPTTASRVVQITGTNSFYVQFTSNTSLSINGAGNLTCSTVASGWHDFWIVRSGSTVTAYQNGTALSGTVSVSTARGGTTFNINSDAAAMLLYDIRAYNTVLSAADIAYYYAAVTTTNGGVKVLPLG